MASVDYTYIGINFITDEDISGAEQLGIQFSGDAEPGKVGKKKKKEKKEKKSKTKEKKEKVKEKKGLCQINHSI